jgi:hypothetical protein
VIGKKAKWERVMSILCRGKWKRRIPGTGKRERSRPPVQREMGCDVYMEITRKEMAATCLVQHVPSGKNSQVKEREKSR